MSLYEKLNLTISVIGASLALGVLVVYFLQLAQMTRATEAAAEAARISQAALISTQRPYVSMKRVLPMCHPDAGRPGHYVWSLAVELENSGATPTQGLTVVAQWNIFDTALSLGHDFSFQYAAAPSIIGPHAIVKTVRATVRDDHLAMVQAGSKHWYMWGRAEYRDQFTGTPVHITRFCVQIVDIKGDVARPEGVTMDFRIHDEHNDVT